MGHLHELNKGPNILCHKSLSAHVAQLALTDNQASPSSILVQMQTFYLLTHSCLEDKWLANQKTLLNLWLFM